MTATAHRVEVLGGHTHVTVFAGKDVSHRANCGKLVFTNDEWNDICKPHPDGGISIHLHEPARR